jgi:hypothetical protein
MLLITIKRARIAHSRRMRHSGERSNGSVRSPQSQSWVDYIINTSGYDFRKGQQIAANATIVPRKLGLEVAIRAVGAPYRVPASSPSDAWYSILPLRRSR